MASSLRVRLQLWYAGILLLVLGANAWLLYYREQRSRLGEIDADLIAGIRFLEGTLRAIPGPEWEAGGKPPGPPRKFPPRKEKDREERWPTKEKDREERWPGPRFGQMLARFLQQLRLPEDLERPRRPGPPFYFAVWRQSGELLKGSPEVPAPWLERDWRPQPSIEQRGPFREAICQGPHGTLLLVGRNINPERIALTAYAWQLVGSGLVVLAAGLAGGWFISTRLFRPIARISATAAAISAANLSQRIDTSRIDSELAELGNVLNATFDRLEAAFAQQARFAADASHELRTPLTILRSQAEWTLSRPRSAEEYRQTVKTCLRAAERMTRLVEGLLTLARADAGRLDLQREPLDLGELVLESVRLLRPLALQKNLQLEMDCLPTPVLGDPVRLSQVVTNLVSNAIHYNNAGGSIVVRVRPSHGTAQLTVTDTGCGIPEADLPHIFERFYRVDRARARASGGHGLGLSICKSIVERHGGVIQVHSQVGEGTTFTVLLPVVETAVVDAV